MGKIKRTRPKLHHGAVKINPGQEKALAGLRNSLEPADKPADDQPRERKVFNFPTGLFAGTVIPPEALVQSLGVPETPEEHAAEEHPRGTQQKKQQTKKEKMKERRERWLNKLSAVQLAREKEAQLAHRRATPIVGDMRILADALPELRPFIRAPASKKQKGVVKKKAEPTDFCQMKPAQKRKLLQMETSRFSEAIKDSAFRSHPLAVIGEHLRKRLKQEEEQS